MAEEMMGIRSDILIILRSGYGKITVSEIVNQGIKAFLQKPVSIIELAQAVRKIIN